MALSRATRLALCTLSLLLVLSVSLHLLPRDTTVPPVPPRLPDAVLCGVKKAGTEALRAILNSHPQVVVSRLMYFYDKNFDRGLKWYTDTLPSVREDQLLIDRTPAYFTGGPELPQRIRDTRADTLLLVVVRDPVDRNNSEVRSRLDRSCYSRHMQHWMDTFPPRQILVVDGDRLRVSPWEELERVQAFLGVDQLIKRRHFLLNKDRGLYCWRVRTPQPVCLGSNKGRTHPDLSEPELELLRRYFSACNAEFRSQVAQLPDPPAFQWPY